MFWPLDERMRYFAVAEKGIENKSTEEVVESFVPTFTYSNGYLSFIYKHIHFRSAKHSFLNMKYCN